MRNQWHPFGMAGLIVITSVQAVQAEEISITSIQLNAIENRLELPLESSGDEPFSSPLHTLLPVAQAIVQITNVRIDVTQEGLNIVLETPSGLLAMPATRTVGNALIVDISNAVLALPEGDEFQQANPEPGIALVSVTELPDNRVRIAITGTEAPPAAEVRMDAQGLIVAIASGTAAPGEAAEEETIQIVVTGEEEDSYRVPDAAVGTRTDTPILDIPQSIQVIPQQVIEEQDAGTISETLRNAAGISPGRVDPGSQAVVPVIRGFESQNVLRNGLRDESFGFGAGTGITNIERVEILRGPASVLYGQGNLGGTINLVTEQPLDEPRYELAYTLGQFDRHQFALDFTGTLNAEGTLDYRLNAAYEMNDTFRDFEEEESFLIAPVLRILDLEDTTLTLDLEYFLSRIWGAAPELPALGTVLENPNGEVDRDVNLGEPSRTEAENRVTRLGFRFEHEFNENLSFRSEFLGSFRDTPYARFILPSRLEVDQRSLVRLLAENPGNQQNLALNNLVISNFSTGSIDHEVLVGVELLREILEDQIDFRFVDPIDIFNPDYRPESISEGALRFQDFETQTTTVGIYLQDQIALSDQLILVLGGRLDLVDQTYDDRLNSIESFERQEEAFSPRIGIVYQPSEILSFYASYTRSFEPAIGRERSLDPSTGVTIVGDPFEPERGTQYEIGVKADLLDGRLLTTLALYQLERTNVVTQGPDSPLSSVQVGEQRSRGIELNLIGELLPGWNLLASYAYTDAEITEDNQFEVGNRLPNTPEHAISLWTTYEIQRGDLQGLGFGLGLFFQGDREGDLNNSFELPSYLRADAALFYRRDQFQIGLNLQNLFDTEYYEGARSDVRVIVGEPLTVSGTIRWQF